VSNLIEIHARHIFDASIRAVHPTELLKNEIIVEESTITIARESFSKKDMPSLYVIGAGKASAAMAVEIEKLLGQWITEGIIATKYRHALPTTSIKTIEAGHPLPDTNSVEAAQKTIDLLERVKPSDIIICLISGGASALWCDVPSGIVLNELQITFDLLIRSGATIEEINTVRKHLSKMKGGQLLTHCPGAKVFTFMISDVSSDDPAVIASGPTVPDYTFFQDAYNVLGKYSLLDIIPISVRQYIQNGMQGLIAETLKPESFDSSLIKNKIIGTNQLALEAASLKANELGYEVYVLPGRITGDTEEEAKKFVDQALKRVSNKSICLLAGGETTLKVKGTLKGGRNQHFVLASLMELQKHPSDSIVILSGGTDGTDGPTDAAGAVADASTLLLAAEKKLSLADFLERYDSYHFFQQTKGLILTGPTQTNVMDIMIALIH
jgi:glycerate-2-kinase